MNTFDDWMKVYDIASIEAEHMIRRLKQPGSQESYRTLLAGLKQCDDRRHEAIEGMEKALGHH